MSLFDQDYKYTSQAQDLEAETVQTCRSIFDKYCALGYSPREIQYIMQHAILDLSLTKTM